MSPAVRIIDTIYANVPATAALPQDPIKLTAMESVWVIFPVLQHVLLYESAELPPFDAIVQSLRSSLAATLASFAPLAGRLVYLKDTGDVAIACSDSDAVKLVVAESDADIGRLACDEVHDLPVLEMLVPEVDMSQMPNAVLAVQATRFEGGVAVGLTVHHGVADGRSLWTFVEAWAAACRGETPDLVTPTFDRSLVNLPGVEELGRSSLRELVPSLPVVTTPSSIVEDRARFTRRTFTLDAWDIQRLKQRIVRLGEAHGVPLSRPRPPSSPSPLWPGRASRGASTKQVSLDEDVVLFFFADARDRLNPPVEAGYIGACLTKCLARIRARELRGDRARVSAAAAIQDELGKMREDPVAGWNFLTPEVTGNMHRLMNMAGSPSFKAYDIADFGWGKPSRTEPIRMNHDGQVALMRARDGQGVQVSVSLLQSAQMDQFKSYFLSCC